MFTPSDADIAFYRGLVEAYEKAAAEGSAHCATGAHRQGPLRQGIEGLERAEQLRARDARARRRRNNDARLYFEEFEVGKVYKHLFTRTVTEMDNILFTR